MHNDCHHSHNNNQSNFLSGFVIGALFGGVVALLFMSKNGRKALEDILDRALSLFDNVDSMFSDLEEEPFSDSSMVAQTKSEPVEQPVSQPAVVQAPTLAQAYQQQPAIQPIEEAPVHPLPTPEQELYFMNQSQQFAQAPMPAAPMMAGPVEETRTRRFFHGIPKRRSN